MSKLYFRYGAMGSSKTANAIMVQYNYQERGQNALMLKPRLETRDGDHMVRSRVGLEAPCRYIEELKEIDATQYDCLIVDEAQFLTREQVQQLVDIVDQQNVPVVAYGLRADFQGNLFEGSQWLMAWADTIEEIKTVCWCGRKATCNARIANGRVIKTGEQIMLGGNESYVALCRRHWAKGELAPMEIRRIAAGKEVYLPLLLEADPSEAMIEKYLAGGELYVLLANGQTAGAAVITLRDDGAMELRNLAVVKALRGRGYGEKLVRHMLKLCATRSDALYVGTSPANVGFYERLGFEKAYVEKGYFKDNYPEPIVEDGKALEDMIYLVRKL